MPITIGNAVKRADRHFTLNRMVGGGNEKLTNKQIEELEEENKKLKEYKQIEEQNEKLKNKRIEKLEEENEKLKKEKVEASPGWFGVDNDNYFYPGPIVSGSHMSPIFETPVIGDSMMGPVIGGPAFIGGPMMGLPVVESPYGHYIVDDVFFPYR